VKAWRFYKDRVGDYLAARKRPIARERPGLYEAVAPEQRGNHRTVEGTVVNDRYLARCTEVPPDEVPPVWREALTGAM
jgi:hypothetical protein